MRLDHALATLATLAMLAPACSEPPESPAPQTTGPKTEPTSKPEVPDPAPTDDKPSRPKTAEPGFHLDPDPEPSRQRLAAARPETRRIELVLRSTPPGATASVDGKAIGKTPAYWQGTSDGRPRDVTFALPGYAVARYRFVAIHSGVVHGSLRKLVKAEPPK